MVWSARLNLERMIKGVGEVSYYGFHCGLFGCLGSEVLELILCFHSLLSIYE